MADLKNRTKYNQRRVVNAIVADGVSYGDVNDGAILATLPRDTAAIGVHIVIKTPAATGETIDITYAGQTYAADVLVDSTVGSVAVDESAAYQIGGGEIIATGTLTAGEFDIIVEYIELDKTTGEYTQV
jgi:hypothetical protein